MGKAAKLARRGMTNIFGKLGDPIWIQVPVDIEEIHRRRASEIRMPFREYLREVLSVAAVGREETKRATTERINTIAGKLQD